MSTAAHTMLRIARELPFTRVVLWPGRVDGQASHPSEALLGVYLTHRGASELFYTKRQGADRLYPVDPATVVMVANAAGHETYWKHANYRPLFLWPEATVEPKKSSTGEGHIFEVRARALSDGNFYTVTTFFQFNDASRFLKLVSKLDTL